MECRVYAEISYFKIIIGLQIGPVGMSPIQPCFLQESFHPQCT